ncbi:MAG: sporulation protein YunB [Clostridia bacterium]|nr:sporulation protein YunB [Clostridia bacterium]
MRRVFDFHRQRRRRRLLRGVLVLLVTAALLLTAFFGCRPVLTTFAESQAVWIATKLANKTVAAVLEERAALCRSMIMVTYTDENRLSSIVTDTAAVNMVRTAITASAMTEMEQYDGLSVSIPFGTLAGVSWLSGWGPPVTFPMSFTATVLSDVSSSLEAVGMNQSLYRVLVHLDISLYVVTPGGRSSVGTQLSYPMAEAVLLGEVPDNLTEVYGDDQSILGKIFDYGTAE